MIKVVIKNTKHLYNLTTEERTQIKDELMVNNPAYANAKKFSKRGRVFVEKYLAYYQEFKDFLVVPQGYEIPFDYRIQSDDRYEVTVKYPKFRMTPREDQAQAYNQYIEDTNKGVIVLPTGKGKSVLGGYCAYKLKQKTLIIVHKDDLLNGWTKDLKKAFGKDFEVGIIKGKKKNIAPQITVAMIQTLAKLSDDKMNELFSNFGMLIVDEMHHAPSNIYSVVNRFQGAYRIGLTATPERNDGLTQVLNFYFGDFAYIYEYNEDEKDIIPAEVIVKESKVEYIPDVIERTKWNKNKNKWEVYYELWDGEEQGEIYSISDINFKQRPKVSFFHIDDVLLTNEDFQIQVLSDIYNEYKKGRNLLVFFNQKKHCELYHRLLFDRYKIKDMQIYYGDADESKEVMQERAESGEVRITLATYKMATEGTNVNAWEVAFLVSSINNGVNVEQAIGRVRRSKEGKIDTAIVYDYRAPFVYSIKNHGTTRNKRYKLLKFKVSKGTQDRAISRGYFRR